MLTRAWCPFLNPTKIRTSNSCKDGVKLLTRRGEYRRHRPILCRTFLLANHSGPRATPTYGRTTSAHESTMASPFTGGLPLWDEALVQSSFPAPCGSAGSSGSTQSSASPCGESAEMKSRTADCGARATDGEKASAKKGAPGGSGSSGSASLYEAIVRGSQWPEPVPSSLTLEEKYQLCLSIAQECVQPEELRTLLERKEFPLCYDGFEPSGRMHVAQGLLKVTNVNKLTKAGCIFVFWVADWFAMLNNKMGGDLKKIRKVGEYFIEVWKAAGMDMRNVRFLWASEEIDKRSDQYWTQVMEIARSFTITRIKRCSQIMGRQEGDEQPAAQIMYPCMQVKRMCTCVLCADIFYLGADICQLGMDQRKVNMLAREYCDEIKRKLKPIILSHQMLPGLLEGQEKMSKSDPDSAIFMEDTEAEVNRKIKKAFCPPGALEGNPCVSYVEKLVFPAFSNFEVARSEANGGNTTYSSVNEFREAYARGALHPGDLKDSLARALNRRLEPIRKHFTTDEHARKLLQQIKAYKVTK
ncbi:trna synthetases class i family protein [Cystoisospora suis]|uniref:tyrosine--tRNA ligase n=1 Tax=Cystoisospora suis TaxID=483139 RepID=A0A2C6KL32_9APIC|nr:trna synthetases class i family protein [Cystoisospora suis]